MKAVLFLVNTFLAGGCTITLGLWLSDRFLQPGVEQALGGLNFRIAGIAIGTCVAFMAACTIANFLAFCEETV